MIQNLGKVRPGRTLRIQFNTFDKDDGSVITMTNFAVGDILIYKDGGTTERASTAGFTATTDFDAKTGKHVLIIDLADNTTADFFKAGSHYHVGIDAVTVDSVTVGGWVAEFTIGYDGSTYDTFIATLASQTSFTLNEGPAEDDALNDLWCLIHDVASAVQFSWVQILDYTGSTKTVTLAAGAKFTVAAGDNISIMGPVPLQASVTGAKQVVQTGDAYARLGAPAGASVSADVAGVKTDSGNLVTRLGTPADLGGGASIAKNLEDIEAQTDDIGAAGAGLTAADDAILTALANVQSDTDNIQTRLPAALVGGRMDSSIGALAAGVIVAAAFGAGAIDAAALATDAANEIRDAILSRALASYTVDGTVGDVLRRLMKGAQGLVPFTVGTGSTTTVIETDLTEATDDHYNGRTIVFLTGALAGQGATIADYAGATKRLTIAAATDAPANGDLAVIA